MPTPGERLAPRLPDVRGRLQFDRPLADLTWFRVGGPADVLFSPADEEDLAHFLAGLDEDIPVQVIGVGSNLLVRDAGVPGVVVRLGRGFGEMVVEDGFKVRSGTAVPDVRLAGFALEQGITLLTFLRGIPGTIGGALRMNAGAHGGETRDILLEARGIDRRGELRVMSNADMGFSYRHCSVPPDVIFTSALFQGAEGDREEIRAHMQAITEAREASQPIKSRTGGSTFKNPEGGKSWQLIDAAGMRGFSIGPAKVSEMHCNFLINEGGATAAQIEELGETVRARVFERSGMDLQWEIRRIGVAERR
jgi:UDP-N-acetylmuramate dehydrogenase